MFVFCKTLDLVSTINVACIQRPILTFTNSTYIFQAYSQFSIHTSKDKSAYQTLGYYNNNVMLKILLIFRNMTNEYVHIYEASSLINEYCLILVQKYCLKFCVEEDINELTCK